MPSQHQRNRGGRQPLPKKTPHQPGMHRRHRRIQRWRQARVVQSQKSQPRVPLTNSHKAVGQPHANQQHVATKANPAHAATQWASVRIPLEPCNHPRWRAPAIPQQPAWTRLYDPSTVRCSCVPIYSVASIWGVLDVTQACTKSPMRAQDDKDLHEVGWKRQLQVRRQRGRQEYHDEQLGEQQRHGENRVHCVFVVCVCV